jgi:hypothetical protein
VESGPTGWVHMVWMVRSGWANWVYAESTPMLSIGVEYIYIYHYRENVIFQMS